MAPADPEGPAHGVRSDESAPAFVDESKLLIVKRQYQAAVRVCRLGLLCNPSCLDGRLMLGMALLALGRFEQVVSEMRVAIETDPDNVMAYLLRAEALLRLEDYRKAREALARVQAIEPDNEKAAQLLVDLMEQTDAGSEGEPSGVTQTRIYPASAGHDVSEIGPETDTRRVLGTHPRASIEGEEAGAPETTADRRLRAQFEATVRDEEERTEPSGMFDETNVRDTVPTALADDAVLPGLEPSPSFAETAPRHAARQASFSRSVERADADFEATELPAEDIEILPDGMPQLPPDDEGEASSQTRVRFEVPADSEPDYVVDQEAEPLNVPPGPVELPPESLDQPVPQREPTVGLESGANFDSAFPPESEDSSSQVDLPASRASGSYDVHPWRSSTEHIESAAGESSLDAASSSSVPAGRSVRSARRSRPKLRSVARGARRGDTHTSFLTLILGERRSYGWLILGAICLGVVVLALGIGFLVRSIRAEKQFERRRELAFQHIRRGNVGDYRKAAKVLADLAASVPDNRTLPLVRARIAAALPFEFGETDETPDSLSGSDSQADENQAAIQLYGLLVAGRLEDAANVAFNARNLYPRSALLQYLQGRIELLKGKPGLAVEYLRRADQLQPRNALILATLGRALFETGDLSEAAKQYERALKVNPLHVESLLGRVRMELDAHRLDVALAGAKALITGKYEDQASSDQRVRAMLLAARVHAARGQLAAARSYVQDARAQGTIRSPETIDLLTEVLIAIWDLPAAENAAAKALRLMAGRPRPLLYKAQILLDQQRAGEALATLDGASGLPGFGLLETRAHLMLGQVAEARQALAAAGTRVPRSAVRILEAQILIAGSKLDEAEQLLTGLVQSQPQDARAMVALGQLLLRRGKVSEAEQRLRAALQIDPLSLGAHLAIADALLAAGQLSEAESLLIRLSQTYPGMTPVVHKLARLYLGTLDLAAAKSRLEALLQRSAGDTQARLLLLRVFTEQRDFPAAERQLQLLSGLPSGQRAIAAARLALARGDSAPVLAELRAAVEQPGDDPLPSLLLVRAYLIDNKLKRALDAAREMRKRFARRAETLEAQGRVALDNGDERAAARALERALRLLRRQVHYPVSEARLLVLVGQAYQSRGEPRAALQYYRKAAKICPRCPGPPFREGLVLDELGRTRDAIEALRAAIGLAPGRAEAYYELAKIYEGASRRADALEMYERYLELNPPEEFAQPVRRAIENLKRRR